MTRSPDTTAPPQIGLGPILALCGFGFLVLMGYEVARPAVKSLYQGAYGSENEPWAWLGVALTATLVVSVYSKYAARIALSRLCVYAIVASTTALVALLLALSADIPGTPYLLYLWKDVYIVVLIEIFWSIANSIFRLKTARWLYGLLLVMGSVGAVCGGRIAKALSATYGTEATLWALLPLLLLCLLLGRLVPYVDKGETKTADLWTGFRVMKRSDYLGVMLSIVAITQVAITLIDYDFSVVVQQTYPDTDTRTGVLSDVFSTINLVALGLQLSTGAILALIGVRGALLGVPLILGGSLLAFLISPIFGVMVVVKVASKSLDYSIFRAAKELLYLPLTQAEKTQGKALIDMLTYRVAKGGASILLLILKKAGAALFVASALAFGLVGAWLLLTLVALKRYQRHLGRSHTPEADAN